jgi:hypothetical protein
MCRYIYDVSLPNITCLGKSCTIRGLYKPLGLKKVEASRISRQSPHESGKFVSPKHRPPVPSRIYHWYSFPLEVFLYPRAIV